MPIDVVPHRPILGTLHAAWADETACAAFAQRLAASPALRDAFITLEGPLGAGKTTFVRHLLRSLGVQGRVKSPTYAVMEPHEVGGLVVSHFDFYRFADPREWEDAGFRDVFAAPGLKVAEWPGNAAGMLPRPDLAISIEPSHGEGDAADDRRDVTLLAGSGRGVALLEAVR